jgi:hypothetical protein
MHAGMTTERSSGLKQSLSLAVVQQLPVTIERYSVWQFLGNWVIVCSISNLKKSSPIEDWAALVPQGSPQTLWHIAVCNRHHEFDQEILVLVGFAFLGYLYTI